MQQTCTAPDCTSGKLFSKGQNRCTVCSKRGRDRARLRDALFLLSKCDTATPAAIAMTEMTKTKVARLSTLFTPDEVKALQPVVVAVMVAEVEKQEEEHSKHDEEEPPSSSEEEDEADAALAAAIAEKQFKQKAKQDARQKRQRVKAAQAEVQEEEKRIQREIKKSKRAEYIRSRIKSREQRKTQKEEVAQFRQERKEIKAKAKAEAAAKIRNNWYHKKCRNIRCDQRGDLLLADLWFHKDRRSPDGHSPQCKICTQAKRRLPPE